MAQRIVDHTVDADELEKARIAAEKREREAAQKAKQAEETSEEENSESTTTSSKAKKVRGKNYKDSKKNIDTEKEYEITEALKAIKKAKYSNFVESYEVHVNLGIDPRNSDQRIRFTTTLPHGIGKEIKILVISDDNAGEKSNVNYRDESAIQEIIDGKLNPGVDFDSVIANPMKMKDLAKAARILGPKGMMPSPKTGTVTENIDEVIGNLSKGQIEVRSQSGHSVLHQSIGKTDFKDEQVIENFNHLINEINNNNPGKLKQKLIQKVSLSSTMSPSVKVAVA